MCTLQLKCHSFEWLPGVLDGDCRTQWLAEVPMKSHLDRDHGPSLSHTNTMSVSPTVCYRQHHPKFNGWGMGMTTSRHFPLTTATQLEMNRWINK